MVLAEDPGKSGTGIPWRVYGGDKNRKVVFLVSVAYLIGWIGIIGSMVPGTEN